MEFLEAAVFLSAAFFVQTKHKCAQAVQFLPVLQSMDGFGQFSGTFANVGGQWNVTGGGCDRSHIAT